jgi:hypothetical protein
MQEPVLPNENVGWFVMDANKKVIGPLPIAKLRKLLASWPFGPRTFVSTDQHTWSEAYQAGFFPDYEAPEPKWWHDQHGDPVMGLATMAVAGVIFAGIIGFCIYISL